MSFPRKSLFLLLFLLHHFTSPVFSASDYTTLVYKGCSKDLFTEPNGAYSQALSSLFGTLVSQSTKVRFFKSTTSSITGLFQCRGDLSPSDCYNCVSRLPVLSDKLCGKTTASRVQLLGCYMLYEVAGFSQISGMELLFKTCGGNGKRSGGSGVNGFEEKRDTAFSVMESGVVSGHGFYATSYQGMYVVGQCEGDVGDSDCGECVKSAVQRAEVECGGSLSGQVYLHKCFIGYSYYPNGLPKGHPSYASPLSSSSSSSSSGQNTGKTVAIILGGAAGVAFLVILLLFARSLIKKHDDY